MLRIFVSVILRPHFPPPPLAPSRLAHPYSYTECPAIVKRRGDRAYIFRRYCFLTLRGVVFRFELPRRVLQTRHDGRRQVLCLN